MVEPLVPAVANPVPVPVIVRQPAIAPSALSSPPRPAVESRAPAESEVAIERRTSAERPARMERSDTEAGDGGAVIDWLLKDRR